ncbi:hypothetical protein C8J57DRAFT_1501752 [Mycena rebaudengoi]|nr:hypothetical protein C8J57DRAFT_1501752 [Mycena rebaudengoi]
MLYAVVSAFSSLFSYLERKLPPEEGEGSDSADGPEAQPRPQPRDEESLVVVSSSDEPAHGLSRFLSEAKSVAVILCIDLASAAVLRPRDGTPFVLGTLQVLAGVFKRTGIVIAAIVAPLLLISLPLAILWILVKRLNEEPFRTSSSRFTAICTRVLGTAFIYLLALEGLSLSPSSRHFAVFQNLIWQAAPLAHLFKWVGLIAYPIALMTYLTDHTAGYLLRRALNELLIPIPPRTKSRYQRLISFTLFVVFPLAMVFNGYIFPPPSPAWDAFISTAIFMAWVSLGVIVDFLFDFLTYWVFFAWAVRSESTPEGRPRMTTLEAMASSVFGFIVGDLTGRKYAALWAYARREIDTDSEEKAGKEKAGDGEGGKEIETDVKTGMETNTLELDNKTDPLRVY